MAVLEAGVMFGGIPVVKINYYDDKATDSMLTAGLLEAIQAFAVEIFNDETETFKMKRYTDPLNHWLGGLELCKGNNGISLAQKVILKK